MRLVYKCGYDGNTCEKYKVQLDDKGFVKPIEPTCDPSCCDRCWFMGRPWFRLEMTNENCEVFIMNNQKGD